MARPSVQRSDPYGSRTGETWDLVARREPVVWGSGDGPLSPAEVDAYARDGFVVLDRVFHADEVGILRACADVLAVQRDPDSDPVVITEPGSRQVRSIFRVHRDEPAFVRLAAGRRLAGVARQILGSEVYIHQSRVNFKPGFDGREFAWHSDFETWHVEDGMPRMRALSAVVLLTDNTAVNGPLMVVPGSHRAFVRCVGATPPDHHQQSLKEQRIGVPPRQAVARLVAEGGIVQALGPAGSVVLFDCNLLHASAGNLTPWPRHNVFLVYNSVDNPLGRPFGGRPPRPGFLAEREPE